MNKLKSTYQKLHRWPGFILSFILLYYGVSGIFMNHRELFARWDINRNLLPATYSYQNWNNAGLKGNLYLSLDSILVYGNIGIWLTDSNFVNYTSVNQGFPSGSDHRKIIDVHRTRDGHLYAATLFGFYAFNQQLSQWEKFDLPDKNERFTGIESIDDTLYVINRSYLYKGKSAGIRTLFTRIELPAPEGYAQKATLFSTIWQIHSGEILGLPGKLFVDLLGLLTVFLSLTGIIYFIFPAWIKGRTKQNKPVKRIAQSNRWSLNWHNKIGRWLFIPLIVLFLSGMFLRPPLLIAIANARVSQVKFSHLDQPNPWYDKLRDILYDPMRRIFILSTAEGMYYFNPQQYQPRLFAIQPPVSVMGINSLQPYGNGAFLIGSFSGLFLWHPDYPEIYNFITGAPYAEPTSGRPIGDYKVTGVINRSGNQLYFIDYDAGILALGQTQPFPVMPDNIIKESKMSLWNACLELHTGRIFQNITGIFYILIVPLTGLLSSLVVFSGYMVWRKRYKKRKIEKTTVS